MQTWEYQTLSVPESRFASIGATLNEWGAQGWEAIAMFGIKKGITADQVGVLLKRPVTE